MCSLAKEVVNFQNDCLCELLLDPHSETGIYRSTLTIWEIDTQGI